jgi:hypothetical protein
MSAYFELRKRRSEAASLYDLYSRLVRETFKEKGFYKELCRGGQRAKRSRTKKEK